MEPTTVFIAQLMGPIGLAMGFGIFLSKNYYLKTYRNLENETLGVLIGGISALVIGILILLNHNTWSSGPEIAVSIIGWLALVKGILLLVFPKAVDAFGDKIATSGTIPYVGAVALAIGAYLSWVGFLA